MKGAVVLGVRTDIRLIDVDAVDAVQAVGVAELDIDRFVQIPVEFRPNAYSSPPAGLALLEIQAVSRSCRSSALAWPLGGRARPSVKSNSGAFT